MTRLKLANGLFHAAIAAVLIFGAAAPARAQTDGRFTGAVIDPSGALVPNATVTAKNERTGEERTVIATTQGRYVIPNLKPSEYTLKTQVEGFAPLEFTGLTLAVGQEFSLD